MPEYCAQYNGSVYYTIMEKAAPQKSIRMQLPGHPDLVSTCK